MLKAVNISKTFRLHEAGSNNTSTVSPLRGADFQMSKGEKTGIIGKSGEGKSTFARILCGFTPPDSGNVYYEGKPLFDSRNRYDRKTGAAIQLISQQPYQSLDPMQRVGSSVIEALLASKREKNRKEAKLTAEELFETVWLTKDVMSRLPSQLSGGQVQRVAIARALAVNPSVLISDEATAMLDISSQAQIISLLNELVSTKKLSVLFISHDESLVKAFTNKRYILNNGTFKSVND